MDTSNKTYRIMGQLRGQAAEEIDSAHGDHEANHLIHEYQLAFGDEWTIWAEDYRGKPLLN